MSARIQSLPDGIVPYGKSPRFTAANLPEKLKNTHDLKARTWERLNVLAGQVTYYLDGETQGLAIKAGEVFIIPPQEKHFVKVTDDTQLYIEFCAKPKTLASPPCQAHDPDFNDNGYMDWAHNSKT